MVDSMSQGTFPIRRAQAEDADAVQQISADAYTPAYREVIGAVPKPAYEDYRPRIERGEVWVIETDRPLGVIVLENEADHLLIYSIAVIPEMAGRGLGSALLAFADRRAIAAGLPEVRLYTNQRMTRNLRLYARSGFREIGRRPHPSRPGEVLVDMAKAPASYSSPPS